MPYVFWRIKLKRAIQKLVMTRMICGSLFLDIISVF